MSLTEHRPMFGESGYERNALDAYWTPAWCTEELLNNIAFRGDVWEPACGKGHIAKVLRDRSYAVMATDIRDYGYERSASPRDFLQCSLEANGSIITNPPYEHAEAFIRHALKLTAAGRGMVAMLLRNEYDCASSRVDLFDSPPFFCKLVLTKRPRWSEDDKASPRHNFAWFVWDWQFGGAPKIIYQRKSS